MTEQPQAPPNCRSAVLNPHRPTWQGEIAACCLWLTGRALSATWRLKLENQCDLKEGPLIAAIWHNRLALAMPIWRWWQARHPAERLAALMSASRDGALLARTFSYFGVKPIRGSSSRRGPQALLELTSVLKNGYDVAITPDGPRGPKYKVQSGIISLAQITGVPILPFGVSVARKKELRSWDAFQIPLPFTRCRATLGHAIRVPRNAAPAEREELRAQLESTMLRMNRDEL
jgi:lysophospholipid acyltransferase (LPLAT)-like uncharacterized protein